MNYYGETQLGVRSTGSSCSLATWKYDPQPSDVTLCTQSVGTLKPPRKYQDTDPTPPPLSGFSPPPSRFGCPEAAGQAPERSRIKASSLPPAELLAPHGCTFSAPPARVRLRAQAPRAPHSSQASGQVQLHAFPPSLPFLDSASVTADYTWFAISSDRSEREADNWEQPCRVGDVGEAHASASAGASVEAGVAGLERGGWGLRPGKAGALVDTRWSRDKLEFPVGWKAAAAAARWAK